MKRLGVYWSVSHRRPQDYDYFKQLQPTVFKIMDGGPPDYAWAKANLPNSLIIARDWAMSEQKDDMRRDPVGTGRRHADEWQRHVVRLGFDRTKTLILGINEPSVWEAGVPEALRQYTIAMCDRATELGLRVGAMQLSVGWPDNTGPDTPPDWAPFAGVEEAIRRGNHVLCLHEYWADGGPSENWGWWAGRALKCPWQVPIVIGECGVDMYVKDASVSHTSRGWFGRMSPTRYATELAEYTQRMSNDPRFVGCCVFASDFANREWWSFDVEPAYQAILSMPIASVSGNNGTTKYIPHVGTPPSAPTAAPVTPQPVQASDKWQRCIDWVLRWEGGYVDHPHDPGGETNFGITKGSYPDLDIANLTKEQAKQIYFRDYWLASGADGLDWPLCLAVFDTAVNAGTWRAKHTLIESDSNFLRYMGLIIDWYTRIDNFEHFGKAWIRRRADLLIEASRP